MNRKSVSQECEEMRCLFELQQQEFRRQQRKIEVQRRRIDTIQDELDTLYGKIAAPQGSNRRQAVYNRSPITGDSKTLASLWLKTRRPA